VSIDRSSGGAQRTPASTRAGGSFVLVRGCPNVRQFCEEGGMMDTQIQSFAMPRHASDLVDALFDQTDH